MPVWIILLLVGTGLSVLGLAGLGSVLLWIGVAIILSGIVLTVVSIRRREPQVRAATTEPTSSTTTWQRRAARLGGVALGLGALAVALLAGAIWLVATARPA